MHPQYVPLSDSRIRLEPLTRTHIQSMRQLSGNHDIWTLYTEDLSNPDDLEKWMTARLNESERGDKFSYAVILVEKNQVIGTTSFGHFDWNEKCVEIGWTWLGHLYIGSGINKNMKFLMLQHAFDAMGTERLELRTDELNARSRKAMEKIGAKYDGTLRNHRSTQGGRRRNTVIYSIIRTEWKAIRESIFKEF